MEMFSGGLPCQCVSYFCAYWSSCSDKFFNFALPQVVLVHSFRYTSIYTNPLLKIMYMNKAMFIFTGRWNIWRKWRWICKCIFQISSNYPSHSSTHSLTHRYMVHKCWGVPKVPRCCGDLWFITITVPYPQIL